MGRWRPADSGRRRQAIRLAISLLLVALAAPPVPGYSQGPKDSADKLVLSLPGLSWSLLIDAPGFVIETDHTRPDAGARYVYAINTATDFVLSARVVKGGLARSSQECRAYYWDHLKKSSPFSMSEVRLSDVGPLAVLEYVVKEYQGLPVRQKHLNAYFGKDDVCADIHLSKVRFTPGDDALMHAILRSVRVDERIRL